MKVGAPAVQLCEITLDDAERGIELHPHRQHPITCNHTSIPDLAPLIGVLVAVRIDHNIFAHDLADLCRASELLIPIRGKVFRPEIGKPKIVKATTVKDGNNLRALTAERHLVFDDKVSRKLVDCTVHL